MIAKFLESNQTRPVLDWFQDCYKNCLKARDFVFLLQKSMLWLLCRSKLKPPKINRQKIVKM